MTLALSTPTTITLPDGWAICWGCNDLCAMTDGEWVHLDDVCRECVDGNTATATAPCAFDAWHGFHGACSHGGNQTAQPMLCENPRCDRPLPIGGCPNHQHSCGHCCCVD